MHQLSFGSVLKEARISKGLDVNAVAKELRIRQDIIVALENADFNRMPPRGYARNMIIAYARLVGLNPTEVSRMYLDQEYANQIERAHRNASETVSMHRAPSGRTSSSARPGEAEEPAQAAARSGYVNPRKNAATRDQGMLQRSLEEPRTNRLGRTMYTQDMDDSHTRSYGTRQGSVYGSNRPHQARRSSMPEGKYTNLYAAPRNIQTPASSRRPFIIAGVVAIAVIVLLILLFLNSTSKPQENIPVTGLESKAEQQQAEEQAQAQLPTAPTNFTLAYKLDSGVDSWIEVYVDGEAQEAADVTGPAEKSYTSEGTIRFISSATSGVTVTINGEAVAELEQGSAGIIDQTFDFATILDQWYTAHPEVQRPSTTTSSSGQTTTSTSSGTSSSASGSSTSTSS